MFIEQDENGWLIAFSEKAISSMEALLLDRYRTYAWIQFHHKVIGMKMLVRFLIRKALELGAVKKEDFDIRNVKDFVLRDDVWLWNVLRNMKPDDHVTALVQKTVFYRQKGNILNLWKTRPVYHDFQEQLRKGTRSDVVKPFIDDSYKKYLDEEIKIKTLIFELRFFKPVGRQSTFLYSESAKKLTGDTLLKVSELVASLERIWKNEPQYFVLFVGNYISARTQELRNQWVDLTINWINK